jgi:putative transposase
MNTSKPAFLSYHGYRFPSTIISQCVWWYFRFSLSYRDIEEMMAERGIVVTYESIREWCVKFGATRRRERRMPGFKSPGYAQRFRATFGVVT